VFSRFRMSSETQDASKEAVRSHFISELQDDPEGLARVFFYLDEEERVYSHLGKLLSPAWRTLILLHESNCSDAFAKYCRRLVDDTQRAETDQQFRTTMAKMYENFLPPSESGDNSTTELDMSKLASFDNANSMLSIPMGLARAWDKIPKSTQKAIAEMVSVIAKRQPWLTGVDEMVGLVSKHGGSIVMVGLAVAQLSYEMYQSICRWLKGEISGKRCCKNILDAGTTLAAGMGGGYAGAVVGSVLGPVGTFVGGIVGGVSAAKAAEILGDYLTQKIFGLPKEAALENAYRYFGLGMSPSNNEINEAYRALCLKHHPDKGGRTEDFQCVQIQLAIIRFHREEKQNTSWWGKPTVKKLAIE